MKSESRLLDEVFARFTLCVKPKRLYWRNIHYWQMTGLYRAIGGGSNGSTSGVFRTLIIANNVGILGKDVGRCAHERKYKKS